MNRKGRLFEEEYQRYFEIFNKDYQVLSPAYLPDQITGWSREIDILIKYNDNFWIERKIAIECRDRPKTIQDVMWIEQLITKKNDLSIDFLIATTTKKFSKPAIIKAIAYWIILESAMKIDNDFIKNLPNTQICNFSFLYTKIIRINTIIINNKNINPKKNLQNISYEEKEIIKKELNKIFLPRLLTEEFRYKLWRNINYEEINPVIMKMKSNSAKINYMSFDIKLKIININIPIINGLIIKDPKIDFIKWFRREYENEILKLEEGFNQNEYLLKIDFKENINPKWSLLESTIIPPTSITFNNSVLKIQFNRLESLLWEIDFSELW